MWEDGDVGLYERHGGEKAGTYLEQPAGRERDHGQELERRREVFDVVELLDDCTICAREDLLNCVTVSKSRKMGAS